MDCKPPARKALSDLVFGTVSHSAQSGEDRGGEALEEPRKEGIKKLSFGRFTLSPHRLLPSSLPNPPPIPVLRKKVPSRHCECYTMRLLLVSSLSFSSLLSFHSTRCTSSSTFLPLWLSVLLPFMHPTAILDLTASLQPVAQVSMVLAPFAVSMSESRSCHISIKNKHLLAHLYSGCLFHDFTI